jgi:hypothetical protein
MNARTKTLFHFTKRLDRLLRILQEGFWPQYSLEDVAWLDGGVARLAWPMVSFCDIPISRVREHTEFYGSYGIGLCRERWRATGLNPLLYVSPGSILRDSLKELLLEVRKNPDPRSKTNAMIVLAHCKPLEGLTEVNGEIRKKDFYSECESRFTPWVEGGGGWKHGFLMEEQEFRDKQALEEANDERRNDRMLKFVPADVRYLLVKSVEDVPQLVRCINTELASYSPDVLDVLKTRITVLDEICSDF